MSTPPTGPARLTRRAMARTGIMSVAAAGLLSTAGTAHAVESPTMSLIGDGTTDNSPIIAALPSGRVHHLDLAPGRYRFATSAVVPANVQVRVPRGAILQADADVVVTFRAQPEAGHHQVYAGPGMFTFRCTEEV